MKFKILFLTLVVCLNANSIFAQVGYGFTFSNDLYQRFSNPDDGIASKSSGSAIFNLGLGPKLWFGGSKFSLSVESQAKVSFFALSIGDYKGLGAFSFPIMAKLNFSGLSGFDREGKTGFYVGFGIQYSKTEAFGLTEEFLIKGVERDYFKTYNVQVGYGYGLSGFGGSGFINLGYHPDTKANFIALGMQFDFNIPMLKKIANPESQL